MDASDPDTPASVAAGARAAVEPRPFRLLRYFAISTAVAFAVVAAVLVVAQEAEVDFFEQTQDDQARSLAAAQADLAKRRDEDARRNLLAVHEAGHVNLTRVVANTLWAEAVWPLVAAAQGVDVEPCRALVPAREASTATAAAAAAAAAAARVECQAAAGRRIRALPAFAALDARARSAMSASSVFKIKVFDLRGITVYSSEAAQAGEDGSGNAGWAAAAAGRAASELTHRDRFSAFERVVENRDLISSYVPVYPPGGERVAAVFELYSDVTPLLEQMRAASRQAALLSAAYEERRQEVAQRNRERVRSSSNRLLAALGGLLVVLYASLLGIVRVGQRIIDRQAAEQAAAAEREQLWHQEKMAALATMAANVSHEVGNPLAVIAGVAAGLPAHGATEADAQLIGEQTRRIATMMRSISDFAGARGSEPEWVDLNALLKPLCDFHRFDRRFRGVAIAFEPAPDLPALEVVPDHFNEVMMNLLRACVEARATAADGAGGLTVASALDGGRLVVRVGCTISPALLGDDPRCRLAVRRAAAMGARLVAGEYGVTFTLPQQAPPGPRTQTAG